MATRYSNQKGIRGK